MKKILVPIGNLTPYPSSGSAKKRFLEFDGAEKKLEKQIEKRKKDE